MPTHIIIRAMTGTCTPTYAYAPPSLIYLNHHLHIFYNYTGPCVQMHFHNSHTQTKLHTPCVHAPVTDISEPLLSKIFKTIHAYVHLHIQNRTRKITYIHLRTRLSLTISQPSLGKDFKNLTFQRFHITCKDFKT